MTARGARVATDDLAVGHGKRSVLSGVDLRLPAGEVTLLVGPNGCGKSTLLRTVAGLLPPLAGTIEVDGMALRSLSRRALSRRLAFLPQTPQIPAGVTARELVRHGRYAHRGAFARHNDDDRDSIEWALSVTNAEPLADSCLDEMSGGERQRAWLATVLAQRASTLLLDEPTTYLDLRHQFEVLDVVRALAKDYGIACGVVLHDLTHAAAYGDRVVVIADGAIVRSGPPEQVLRSEAIEQAFGIGVNVLRDPETGRLACFPQRPHAVA